MYSMRDLRNLPPEQRELMLDVGQIVLDVVGIFEPTPFADLSNSVVSLFRRDWWGAGLTVIGVVPYFGDLAKLGKAPKYLKTVDNAIQMARNNAKFAELLQPLLGKLKSALERVPMERLPSAVAEKLQQLWRKINDFLPGGGRAASRLDQLTDDVLRRVFGSTKNVGILPRRNVRTIVEFFDKYEVSGRDPAQWAELLKGIDLHAAEPVKVIKFNPGELVGQYVEMSRPANRRIGQWMTRAQGAVSHRNIGLSGAGRERRVYRVKQTVEVLQSKAAAAADHWTGGPKPHTAPFVVRNDAGVASLKGAEHVAGGGDQFFLPRAWEFLEEVATPAGR